ncbi:hypothetical protein EVAR_38030_1 [Eumeta japonica]|uniref:Uncharacterized protein n=1 Tax=Eumeta variegata TaxID=151549 RepID=A0A4C1W7C9_EUMVA|nr:hypothetical protein EVAR_38030_1 [Eumeta japonica]
MKSRGISFIGVSRRFCDSAHLIKMSEKPWEVVGLSSSFQRRPVSQLFPTWCFVSFRIRLAHFTSAFSRSLYVIANDSISKCSFTANSKPARQYSTSLFVVALPLVPCAIRDLSMLGRCRS